MSTNDFQTVEWRVEDAVGFLTLNRPNSLNAISNEMVRDLSALVDEIEYNSAIRSVVLTGAGRAFSAGADVKEWDPEGGNDGSWVPKMHTLMTRLYWLRKPVVAAVNGIAVGAGCDLTLVADIRIASESARFGEAYVNLGYCPDIGGSYLLPRLIGESRAMELIYTGRTIDADEASQIGLVSRVVAPEALMDVATEQARVLASGPTVAIGLAKRAIRKGHSSTFEESLRNERISGELCSRTEDNVEGLNAINEKRVPEFKGR